MLFNKYLFHKWKPLSSKWHAWKNVSITNMMKIILGTFWPFINTLPPQNWTWVHEWDVNLSWKSLERTNWARIPRSWCQLKNVSFGALLDISQNWPMDLLFSCDCGETPFLIHLSFSCETKEAKIEPGTCTKTPVTC